MPPKQQRGEMKKERSQQADVRTLNIENAIAVANVVKTSLGPRGLDKLIIQPKGDVLVTNDGATILKELEATHPCAKMMVDMSKAQDVEAGDGTTSSVIAAGSLLNAVKILLNRGIHATTIGDAFLKAQRKSVEILEGMADKVELSDDKTLIEAATTSLSSKVVSQSSKLLAPMAVNAVKVLCDEDPSKKNVDLNFIKMVKVLGGSIDDTEMVQGLVLPQKASKMAGGPSKISNAKVALIQFQLSPPKTDMENNVVITDYAQMDRVLREEREYLLGLCKKIAKSGCNVLLIQKSILRDAVTETSLHFLAKMKIMVVRDVERTDVEFICKSLGCLPIASIDHFSPNKFGYAEKAEEMATSEGKIVKITGVKAQSRAVSIMLRGATKLLLDESERSMHDALCVVRCLVKNPKIVRGGGAPETEVAVQLRKWAMTLEGVDSVCVRAYADALEVIPEMLALNAGLNPVEISTQLRKFHYDGKKFAGIDVRKGCIVEESAVQVPLLVVTSMLEHATETVLMILRIDDILRTR
jgi:T-complex protein 1 subunit delta